MIYFLDFDRVLFDTDAYLQHLPEEPGCAPFRDELLAVVSKERDETLGGGEKRLAVWDKISDAFQSGALSFSPGALQKFLYPDVSEVLRHLGNEAVIISYGEETRQKMKVESALANMVRVTVLYIGQKSKAEFLSGWPGYHGQPAILVDDRPLELEALAAKFSALRLFEMRRDGKLGDGRWPVVHSLNELP